jgi:uncharacterized membrane protein
MRTERIVPTPDVLSRVASGLSLLIFGGVLSAIAWFGVWIDGSLTGFIGLVASVLCIVGASKMRAALLGMLAGAGATASTTAAQRAEEPRAEKVVAARVEPRKTVRDVVDDEEMVIPPARNAFSSDKPAKVARKEEPAGPSWTETIDWEQWVGKKLLQKAGILVVLIGMVVLLKYSFDNRWIGELGRVMLGVLGAALMIGSGEWFSRRYALWAHAFTGGGLALLYFTVWVAHVFYAEELLLHHDLVIPPLVALFLYALITGIGALASIRYRSQAIAWFTLLGGYATPFLIEGVSQPLMLAAYLGILAAGLIALAWKQSWKYLNLACFALTQLYLFSMVYPAPAGVSDAAQIGVAVGFFVLFNALPLLHQFALRKPAEADDVLLLVANGLAVFIPVVDAMGGIAGEYTAFVCLALAAVYLGFGALALGRRSDDAALVNTYLVGTIVLIALAMLQEMRTPEYSYVAAGWAPLSALLAYVAARLRRQGPWVCAVLLLFGSFFFLLLNLPGIGAYGEEVWYPFTSRYALQSYVVFASLLAWLHAAKRIPASLLPETSRPAVATVLHVGLAVLLFLSFTFEAARLDFTPDLTLTFAYLLFAVVALTVYMLSGSVVWFGASLIVHAIVLLLTFVAGHETGMSPFAFGGEPVTPFVHPWAGIAVCALVFTCCLLYAVRRGPDTTVKAPEMGVILIGSALAQLWLHLTVEIGHYARFAQLSDASEGRLLSAWWILFAAGLIAWGVRRGRTALLKMGIALLCLPFLKDLFAILTDRFYADGGFYETVLWTIVPLALAFAGGKEKRRDLLVAGVVMLCGTAAIDMLAHVDAAAQAGFLRSIWWALAALATIVGGFGLNEKLLRSTGIVIFGVVTFKLLVIDFSALTTGVRIGASIATGLLMIGASYLYQRFGTTIEPQKP